MGVSSRYEQHICLIVHLSCQTEKAGDGEQGCEAEGGGGQERKAEKVINHLGIWKDPRKHT